MAYRYGDDRRQIILFPQSIDEYVGQDHPVRAYDAFVDALDFNQLGIMEDDHKVGNSEYCPRTMMKLLIYGYSYGTKSSRKIERELYNNITFIWLANNLKPDHKTISEFRRLNKEPLQKALQLCARLCLKLGLIEGNILFVDGTKIRANAGRKHNHDRQWYEEQLKQLDKRIEQLLAECERVDDKEQSEDSLVKMDKELAQTSRLRSKIAGALEEFRKQDNGSSGQEATQCPQDRRKTINSTDPESILSHSVQGSHAGYNIQSVVDDKNGLIVHVDAVKNTNDSNQFSGQIKQAEAVTGKQCSAACADTGYANINNLSTIAQRENTKVIVPSQRQVSVRPFDPFAKTVFKYDPLHNCYYCPQGHKLVCEGIHKRGRSLAYIIRNAHICKNCKNSSICSTGKKGRKITRLIKEDLKQQLERQYEQPESQEIYKRRKEKVEHPFGHIKRNLGMVQLLLRGLQGAKTEASIGGVCFNVARMITLLGGVGKFIGELKAIPIVAG